LLETSKQSRSIESAPAEADSLTARAYSLLEEMICTLQLPPGTPVSEAELSSQLGIGRTPVREAMQRLARERLLLILPRRGCIVTAIRPEEEVMLIETRRVIETLVMGTAAARASESERQQFAEIAARMKTAQRTHDFDTHARPACGEENPADKRNAQQCQRYWPTQRIDHSENRSNRLGRIVEPADQVGLRPLSVLGRRQPGGQGDHDRRDA